GERRLRCALVLHVREGDLSAALRECEADRAPEPARAAGDEHSLRHRPATIRVTDDARKARESAVGGHGRRGRSRRITRLRSRRAGVRLANVRAQERTTMRFSMLLVTVFPAVVVACSVNTTDSGKKPDGTPSPS